MAERSGVKGPGPGRRRWLAVTVGIVALGGIVYWQFYVPSRYLPQGPGIASLAVVPFESLSPELDRSAVSRGLSRLFSQGP